jgi:hypothetical protein
MRMHDARSCLEIRRGQQPVGGAIRAEVQSFARSFDTGVAVPDWYAEVESECSTARPRGSRHARGMHSSAAPLTRKARLRDRLASGHDLVSRMGPHRCSSPRAEQGQPRGHQWQMAARSSSNAVAGRNAYVSVPPWHAPRLNNATKPSFGLRGPDVARAREAQEG